MTDVLDLLDTAGLTGRGGAAFSTAVKVRAARDEDAAVIVNACDGEIGAAKDAYVVEHHLAELVRGAELVTPPRARSVRYAAHRGSHTATLLHRAGLDVLEAPARYVSSEETSLISLAHGRLARPMTKRMPFVRGGRDADGRAVRPTVVLNAETVWRVAQVAENGPAWFRSFGTPEEPGPRLVTLTGAVRHAGVLETQAGTPLAGLLDAAAADPRAEHLVIGGLGGVVAPMGAARGLAWSSADLARVGGSVGPGIIDVLDPHRCPVATVDSYLQFAAGESAGQCGPCMFGVPALAAAWRDLLVHRPTPARTDAVRAHAGLLPDRGACRFPDGVARFAASALQALDPHLRAHRDGRCPTERTSRVASPA
jgi:NADH:ubiquinone oxidoreductase subunit F (NADH-binding)